MPLLIGTGAVGETATGAPIDTLGYNQITTFVFVGHPTGTDANVNKLDVKWQEAAEPEGTATVAWSDITDGALLAGSMAHTQIASVVGTSGMFVDTITELVSDGNRKRYLRPVATVSGTDGANCVFCVGVVSGNVKDSERYATDPTTVGTGNADYSNKLVTSV